MRSIAIYLFLFTLCILGSACNDDEGGSGDCIMLDNDYSGLVSVNGSDADSLCHEVSEGFPLFIHWHFPPGVDSEHWKFAFEGTEGFNIAEGSADGRDEPDITLIARADSPKDATIKVYAYNECSESNRVTTEVSVRKQPPYAIGPQVSLPQPIASAVTFTYQGKGYILGGHRTPINGITNDHTWVFDPADNSFEELSVSFPDAESAAVVGDTAYILQDSGTLFQVYHIPSNIVVREINTGIQFTEPAVTGHQFSCFAVGDKVYFGPSLFLLREVLAYDVPTGAISVVNTLIHLVGQASITSFQYQDMIMFVADDGTAEGVNTTTGERISTLFPFIISGSDESFVTFFSADNRLYYVTTKGYYSLYPSTSGQPIEMFNGNDCKPTDWTGPNYGVSNFVIDDRVYFVGGQVTEGGAPSDFFQGIRF